MVTAVSVLLAFGLAKRDALNDQIEAIRSDLDDLRSVVDGVSPLMAERGLEDQAGDITTALETVESDTADGLTRSRRPRPMRRGRR